MSWSYNFSYLYIQAKATMSSPDPITISNIHKDIIAAEIDDIAHAFEAFLLMTNDISNIITTPNSLDKRGDLDYTRYVLLKKQTKHVLDDYNPHRPLPNWTWTHVAPSMIACIDNPIDPAMSTAANVP